MRIRTIKPEFWRNRKLAALGREVHDFAARLISASDDEGYLEADPALIASEVYPFDADAQRFIKRSLPELERIGFIELRGGEFGIAWLPGFRDHQRINKPTPSRLKTKFDQLPGKTSVDEASNTPPVGLPEPSLTEVEVEVEVDQEEDRGSGSGAGAEPASPAATPLHGPDELARLWNSATSPPLPKVTLPLGKLRREAFVAALKRRPLSEWKRVFELINESSYCRGSKGWKADVDWATRAEGKKPEPAVKVLEGAFTDTAPTGPPTFVRDPPTPPLRPEGKVLL